ncbi:MAG: hypothetical protein ACLFVK_06695 [Dehalococcoidia bacterium]
MRKSMQWSGLRQYLIIGLLSLLLVSALGCGSGGNLQETASEAVNITRSAESLRSSQIMIQTFNGETRRSLTQSDSVEPDQLRTQIIGPEGWREAIIVGNKCYERDSDKPSWHVCDGVWNLIPLKEELEILRYLVNLKKLPGEEVNGVDCLHYSAEVDFDDYVENQKAEMSPEQLSSANFEQMSEWEMEVELWIARDSHLIRKLGIENRRPTQIEKSEGKEKWVTDTGIKYFYDFNQPIDIELPKSGA